jgi:HK97 family phage major capsid protein
VDSLGAFLDNELRYGLAFAEEQQLLYGSGVSPNLFGIIPQAQPFAPAFTIEVQTQLDVILLAILQAELALFPVTGIVLHPTDFRKMQLIKSSINTYLGNGPWQSGQSTLWGCPVARSLSINEGDFLVGAFGLGAQVFDREDAQIFLSTEDSDNFRRNLVTCLAEERLTLTVPRPQAFVQGSLSGAVTG